MLDLTFGEQVKIVLSRRGMTIKELAELIEKQTGKKMSRQNLTQRLSRDNFQEQDMRMIAAILECPLHLSILDDSVQNEKISYYNVKNIESDVSAQETVEIAEEAEPEPETVMENERDITIGELVDIHEELDAIAQGRQEEMQASAAEFEPEMDEVEELEAEPAQEYEPADGYEPRESYEAAEDYEPEAIYEAEDYEPEIEYETSYDAELEETEPTVEEILEEVAALEAEQRAGQKREREVQEEKPHGWKAYLQRRKKKEMSPVKEPTEEMQETADVPEELEVMPEYEEAAPVYEEEPLEEAQGWEAENTEPAGDINPYTGREYESNSVRMHPKRIGYVQVYDRSDHQWTDMTEWAFLGYQERKKALLGKDYEPPIYLD